MTRYDISMEELRNCGEDIKKTAAEKIRTDVTDLKRLANELKWEGPSYDKFMESFNKKVESLNYVSQVIETYGDFMTVASGGYSDINDKLYDDYLKEVERNESRRKAAVNNIIPSAKHGFESLVIKEKEEL